METILAVVEPAIHPQFVVDRAAWIARLTESRLRLLLCDPEAGSLARRYVVSSIAKDLAADIRAAQEAILDELAAPARSAGLEVETEILDRPAAGGILQRALELEPRVLVKGTQYHSQAERAVFVDTDWQLVRSLALPLWLVKPREMADRPVVIAAVDPTHEDDEHARLDRLIVDEARKLVVRASGEMLLLHSFETLSGIGAEATMTFKPVRIAVDEVNERLQRAHRERFDAFAEALNVDRRSIHLLPGRARDIIPYFAREQKADLVVMGAIARWGRASRVIGSSAEKVLDDLPCDTLIVKLPD